MTFRQLSPILIVFIICSLINGDIDSSFNIPKNVKPIRYTLTVETNMEIHENSSTFNGSVIIELFSSQAASNITLHERNLDINRHTIKLIHYISGTELKVSNIETDEEREFYIIHLEDELLTNEYYNLTIGEFSGVMTYDFVGFYLAKYTTKSGEERNIAVTDFQPTDARKAFPCFDDPSMKAAFVINIIRPANYTAVSNEELLYTEDLGNDRFMDTFKQTVIMPTYVVAYLVSDYKHTQRIERHRIFAKPDAVDNGELDYALSTAVETLKVVEEYTGLNYTNTKMDLVAVPEEYFKLQAMENWGLVTYKERFLLISNETSTTEDIQSCVTNIAHEFSHQWFGNLVTFKEWRYMWLSEGFASYFEFYFGSLVRPSWRLMDLFTITVLQKALEFDSTVYTESMNNYKPRDIGSMPTLQISYYKASSVIRMAQHFVTFDILKNGLRRYLKENKFKSTEPKDLYSALQAIIDEENAHDLLGNNSVISIMETWDSNTGFPLVTVHRNYNNKTITLSQERFFSEKEDENNSTWYIPISYVYQASSNRDFSDTRAAIWLVEKSMTSADDFKSNGWLLINKQQTGYYRVNYDLINWNRLALFLNKNDFHEIHVINRAQIIDDAFNLARSGKVPYYVPLNLSKYLVKETDYIPIEPFVRFLPHLSFVMSSSEKYDIYRNYVIDLLSAAYDYVGFNEKPNDAHLDKYTRKAVIEWLCKFGHAECRNNALRKLREWKENGILSVSVDMKQIVLCNAIRIANTNDWEFLYEKAVRKSSTQYNEYYAALACSENEFILNDYLNRLLNSTILLNKDGKKIFNKIIEESDVGVKVGMNFIRNAIVPEEMQAYFIFVVSRKCKTEKQLEEMRLLASALPGDIPVDELISYNIEIIKESHKEDIENWLLKYNAENIESLNIVEV
ncbi:hypothetical protein ILUMI_10229 [Ignelater luminosus]|uniref:Aminopeptidase n=1 Tax=Ignelater luminosus TaxID=2038154 RepID=A0A8K0D7J4_IGNLU|nr:hypothetical protein ILUMI_10229 [Ignelater luminosus]